MLKEIIKTSLVLSDSVLGWLPEIISGPLKSGRNACLSAIANGLQEYRAQASDPIAEQSSQKITID